MFYQKSIEEVFKELKTSEAGLSEEEAKKRLKQYGPNEIAKGEAISKFRIFTRQFKSAVIVILVVAALISALLSRFIDASIIVAILVLNAVFGFAQEYKAEKTIAALRKLAAPKAVVIRDGKKKIIPASEIVPGDIIVLEAGNYVPADARIIECFSLKLDESLLTGESTAVEKSVEKLNKELPISEQKNMIFASTTCIYGKGKAVVVATGMNTEVGKIAKFVKEEKETKTPLVKKVDELGRFLAVGVVIIAAIIFLIGYLMSKELIDTFLVAISLAVAAIPEGLPAVLTITLALGVQIMAKKNALVRKLPAVETLGSTDVIAADKTGTMTKNEMTVKQIFANNKIFDVTGEGYETTGKFLVNNKPAKIEELKPLFQIAVNCNDADLVALEGDPTELALLVMAQKSGMEIKRYPRIHEIPFSSEQRYMATLHKINNREVYFVKGAPEKILDMCSYINIEGRTRWLSGKEKRKISEIASSMASRALRVLAFAYSKSPKLENLVFVGLVGMIDPPRPEVKDAIKLCKQAGIRVIMLTGDHKETAKAIAKQLNITGKLITGEKLEDLSKKEFEKLVEEINIYARITPEQKLKIVNALKSKGHIVAVTGDGVNDAPALKKADIGVAVGSGTDVAKEASDMILEDNNFATIVQAVKQGRRIFENIKKFVGYLFSCNLGEVLTIFIATLLGAPLILLPVQILWINLITDGLPALALGLEPTAADVMSKKPRSKKEPILKKQGIYSAILSAILMAAGTLFVYGVYAAKFSVPYGRTVGFLTLIFFQLFNALNYKSEKSLFKIKITDNKVLLYTVILSFFLQILIVYLVGFYFHVVKIRFIDWIVCFAVASTIMILFEAKKNLSKIKK